MSNNSGFLSPCCKAETFITDSRGYKGANENPNYVRRRRHCKECDNRFTTVELAVTVGHEYEYGRVMKLVNLIKKTEAYLLSIDSRG